DAAGGQHRPRLPARRGPAEAGAEPPGQRRLGRLCPGFSWAASRRQTRRSEEHTSELQSRGQLVCRLLREKKKGPESERARIAYATVEGERIVYTIDKTSVR